MKILSTSQSERPPDFVRVLFGRALGLSGLTVQVSVIVYFRSRNPDVLVVTSAFTVVLPMLTLESWLCRFDAISLF